MVAVTQAHGRFGLAEFQIPHERGTDLVAAAELSEEIRYPEADHHLAAMGLPIAAVAEVLSLCG
jgi:hypothetical protein